DDAEEGRFGGAGKRTAGSFGHALDFEAEQAEAFHYVGNARRDEAEIFAADEHVGDALQGGKFLQRLFPPEFVLSAEEIVHVKIHQLTLRVLVQSAERSGLVDVETEVELLSIRALNFQEQHVADEIEQAELEFFG